MTSNAEPADPLPPLSQITWGQLSSAPRPAVEEAVRRLSALQLPPVNTALASPEGFAPVASGSVGGARLGSHRGGSCIVYRDHVVVDLGVLPIVDRAALAKLRPYSHVQAAADHSIGPVQLTFIMAQLLVAGVPLLVKGGVPLVAQRLLGGPLTSMLRNLDAGRLADQRYRETWSLRARRLALGQFTSAGRAVAPIAVTVVADLGDDAADRWLAEQIAAQDWPAVQVILAGTRTPARVPDLLRDRGHPVEVVTAESPRESRRRALARADGSLATFMSAGLLYGSHHITDLVLGHGYARGPVGVSVRRSFLTAVNVCVEADGHPGERRDSRLTSGTMLTTPDELGRLEPAMASSPRENSTRGYAVHDLGVARRVPISVGGIDRALTGSVRQWPGWDEVIADPPPSGSPPSWAPPGTDPAYASYFARPTRPRA